MLRTTISPLAVGLLALFVCIGCNQEPEVNNAGVDNNVADRDAVDVDAADGDAVEDNAAENNLADNNMPENDMPQNGENALVKGANQQSPANEAGEAQITEAVCELVAIGDSEVSGTIHFTKQGDTIEVRGEVTGLSPGKHGFHVHEKGDLSDKETGKSAGGHFNPTDQPHGRPSDEKRHVGDLGNIVANEDGTAEVEIDDNVIKLNGPHSIVGLALVVHEKEDTFVQPTGDAGGRVAFGKIEAE